MFRTVQSSQNPACCLVEEYVLLLDDGFTKKDTKLLLNLEFVIR
jgi:hypothetical protein